MDKNLHHEVKNVLRQYQHKISFNKTKKKKKNELIKPKKKLMFLYSYDPKNQPKLRQAQL